MDAASVARLVEACFLEHDGDEFVRLPHSASHPIIPPALANGPIVYATKPRTAVALLEICGSPQLFSIIGRSGLPYDADLTFLRSLGESRPLLFVGDLDPPDLLIFAWLRAQLTSNQITHLGISDRFLAEVGVELPESFTLSCSPGERAALPMVKTTLPDWRVLLGDYCVQLLENGRKIELEAVRTLLRPLGPDLRTL